MTPGYRPNNRRQTRTGYVDHDVFEGLPVRHWRRDYVMVAPPPPTQDSPASQNDVWAVELPYGMPKDSHLLAQHSQDLLRAARSGKIYKRPAPAEEEELDADAILGDKTDKKEDDAKNAGFTARAWKLIPRHLEGADVEYLAKRRKGVVTATKKSASSSSSAPPVMTKATVKRMDAAGNEYVQDIVVPQGQPVDGEVLSQRVIPGPNATALGDGSAVPSKRKIPPPRKKSKGTGKSKKKKIYPPTSVPQAGAVQESADRAGVTMNENGTKIENDNGAAAEDTEMVDGSMATSEDDEVEEGEEGEAGDEEEGDEATPADQSTSPKPPQPQQPLSPAPTDARATEDVLGVDKPRTSVTDFAHVDQPVSENADDDAEAAVGSPLENAALTTSTLSPPGKSPELTPAPDEVPQSSEVAAIDEAMKQVVVETVPTAIPPPPPEPTTTEMKSAVEVRHEEEEEEEMLLDIVENAENANIGGDAMPSVPATEVEAPAVEAVEPVAAAVGASVEGASESESKTEQQLDNAPAPAAEEEDFPDLLSGLEKQLNESVPEKSDIS